MTFNTAQEQFWAEDYAEDYIRKNAEFDAALGCDAWRQMLSKVKPIASILECGCNIGRNLAFLETVLPDAKKSIIEISTSAYRHVTSTYRLDQAFNGSMLDAPFEEGSFDLVYTTGVLIHIDPDRLLDCMRKMFELSGRYILMGEYFNRTPVMLEYQGQKNRLFKRDFGKMFIENFNVRLVDYGFLWGHRYDPAGFDDTTWWLFEKAS